jgi:hypothetical protein
MASGSTPRVDRIDQQLSDTVSVASTVKISNVASQKVDVLYMGTRNDVSIRKKVHYNIAANHGLEIAPTLSTTDKSSANRGKKNEYNVRALIRIHGGSLTPALRITTVTLLIGLVVETFLLHILESISQNDLQRVLNDTSLAGKSMTEIRSIWNELKNEDYLSLANAFFHHMRIEKKHGFGSVLRGCWVGRAKDNKTTLSTTTATTRVAEEETIRYFTTVNSSDSQTSIPPSTGIEKQTLQKTSKHLLDHDEVDSTHTSGSVASSTAGSVASV